METFKQFFKSKQFLIETNMTEHDRRHIYERRRNLLYLISQYLSDLCLEKTHKILQDEAHLNFTEFQICDNVDLETIYLEFCSYYHIKFGKKPRFVKRLETQTNGAQTQSSLPNISTPTNPRASANKKRNHLKTPSLNSINLFSVVGSSPSPDILNKELEMSLQISSISNANGISSDPKGKIEILHTFNGDYMKPNHDFYDKHPSDWRDMIDSICRDIIKKDLCVKWDQVCGSENAKLLLQESVIMPLEQPQLFTEIKPWKAVLLHGVSGTGKTFLARALCSATHHNVTFFNVCSSTLVSKWRGESEKLIRILFELAKYYAPSVLFIDELDSLTSKRDTFEHEASKRFKNEFLTLLDGIESDVGGVFILGSTNLPWEIDSAFLRRFERKILVDVPDFESRVQLIKQYMPCSVGWTDTEIRDIAEVTENYTGDDIRVAIKEANMMEIRRKFTSRSDLIKQGDITIEAWQLKESLKSVKPSPISDILKHRQFNKNFGNY